MPKAAVYKTSFDLIQTGSIKTTQIKKKMQR